MGVEEAVTGGRVHVELGVGVAVVPAVLAGPPQHAALGRALRQAGEDELERSAGLVGAMREVAVIARRDAEHAEEIERDAEGQRLNRHAGPERGEAGQVRRHEQYRRGMDHVVVRVVPEGGDARRPG